MTKVHLNIFKIIKHLQELSCFYALEQLISFLTAAYKVYFTEKLFSIRAEQKKTLVHKMTPLSYSSVLNQKQKPCMLHR